ncbi:hypothetical protein [Paenibacillus sp. Soil787]|uniref:hypothetical protein n=1 Tax=Paenibacillus sp. Soil787 TaxID=1736411 RepID=UPI0006F2B3A4|nr:hypothetical protein [Paenibacillus sp. Soil787]KRF31668.1 hypothetical protein ASG93_04840 [Paenibacillus sp. Soil787]
MKEKREIRIDLEEVEIGSVSDITLTEKPSKPGRKSSPANGRTPSMVAPKGKGSNGVGSENELVKHMPHILRR